MSALTLLDPSKPIPYKERISYSVSPGENESATLQQSGPDKGKYKDDKNGNLYDNNQDWIRAKNSKIPQSSGGAG
jgi:hypothetical protein